MDKQLEKAPCFDEGTLDALLDTIQPDPQQRTRIKACAIAAYWEQTTIPVIKTLVCDDAPQFKLLTQQIALCWKNDGRHYKKLRPIVPQHKMAQDEFLTQYWLFYHQLKAYKKRPDDKQAAILSQAFDTLLSTKLVMRNGMSASSKRGPNEKHCFQCWIIPNCRCITMPPN